MPLNSQNQTEQQIPQDLISEKALMSCLLGNPALLSEIPVNMFWMASHRIVYESIQRLAKNPKVKQMDFAVFRTDISSKSHLQHPAGAKYLNEILGFSPT